MRVRSWFVVALCASGAAHAEAPIREVAETVVVPAGLDPMVALESISDIPRIFELYNPYIPWVPGVDIALSKQVVSAGSPCILELPVSGSAIGKDVVERARVTATTKSVSCRGDGKTDGRQIVLSFRDSTYNIERRIDRIEITACLEEGTSSRKIRAVGRMYAGFKPEDATKNPITETIGSKAIQGAFIRQVTPIVDAVEAHWSDLSTTP
jgi:hypothetical protein